MLTSLHVDQRSVLRGFIIAACQLDDRSALEFRELVDVSQTEPKIMYAYYDQDADHRLIFRSDHAAHRPALPQPEHQHTPSGIALDQCLHGLRSWTLFWGGRVGQRRAEARADAMVVCRFIGLHL